VPPSSGSKSKPSNHGASSVTAYSFMLVHLPHSSTLKIEGVCSSKTSVNFYLSTWHHVVDIVVSIAMRISNSTFISIVRLTFAAVSELFI
jgi:hypothetical protein